MNYWLRKIARQIENATDQTDVESACKVLIMILKKKAEYLPIREDEDDVFMFTINEKEHVIPVKLLKMILKTKKPIAKL